MADEVKSSDDVRVTYQFKKQNTSISINPNLVVNPVMCNFEDATHVITEVTTGFNSYLVFEKSVKKHEKRSEVGGMTNAFSQ